MRDIILKQITTSSSQIPHTKHL